MANPRRVAVTVTTAADGTATAYLPTADGDSFSGRLSHIVYTKTDYATGVDFTITAEGTGDGIWTETNVDATATRAPRQATHDNVGVASLYAAAGEPVEDYIVLAQDRIKIVLASGGNAKTGKFEAVVF